MAETVKEHFMDLITYILCKQNSSGNSSTGGGDLTFVYNQKTSSSEWTINHNLGKYPSVTIIGEFDTGKESVLGDIEYIDKDTLKILFETPITGTAYLN
jgi:hypothetical protein